MFAQKNKQAVQSAKLETAPTKNSFLLRPFTCVSPLWACLVCCLGVLPIFYLQWSAPGILVTIAPSAVLEFWSASIAIGQASSVELAQRLADGQIVGIILLKMASHFRDTPGQAVQLAYLIWAVFMLGPIIYSCVIRFAFIPAVVLVLFLVLLSLTGIANPSPDQFWVPSAVLWQVMVIFAPPVRKTYGIVPLEAIFSGVIIWLFYLTSVPLFLFSIIGLLVPALFYGRRGLLYSVLTYMFFVAQAAALEIFSLLAIPDFSGFLSLRLGALQNIQIAWDGSFGDSWALLPFGFVVMLTGWQGWLIWGRGLLLAVLGLPTFVAAGLELKLLFICISFLTLFARPTVETHWRLKMTAGYSPAILLFSFLLMSALLTNNIYINMKHLWMQNSHAVLAEAEHMGFSFVDEPVLARLVLSRKLEPALAEQVGELTPADQAVLLADGQRLKKKLSQQHRASPKAQSSLVALQYLMIPEEKGKTAYILRPKLKIDPITDHYRIASQGEVYSHYQRQAQSLHNSAAWEVWELRGAE
ncbi:MAG: hypothetical protein ACWA5L_10100 [bacterium]